RLGDALPVMRDVALKPTFPTDELERLRKERLTSLLQSRDDPATIASLAFSRVLYGSAHRYGTATIGTAAPIKAFTAGDLRAFYPRAFRPPTAAVVLVGDVLPDHVLPLLESSFSAWRAPGSEPAPVRLPAAQQPAARAIYLIDKPGAPQSQIRVGWIGVPRST